MIFSELKNKTQQKGYFFYFVIIAGQPQVIKVVQSPTANKHSQLTGQTVKAIIKAPSHDNQVGPFLLCMPYFA